MKYIVVFIAAFIMGYFSYELLHPVNMAPSSKSFEVKEKQILPQPLKADDYKSAIVEHSTENKPLHVSVTVQPEKKVIVEAPQDAETVKSASAKIETKKKLSREEKESQRKFFMTIWKQPFLDVKDSRVQKLIGNFKGKLERIGSSRTGLLENIVFQVNQDPEKGMTKFEIIDVYDNTTFNFYEPTVQTFRSVPGDENTLVISRNNELILLNLKTFPKIEGQLYNQQSQQLGIFNLRKTK